MLHFFSHTISEKHIQQETDKTDYSAARLTILTGLSTSHLLWRLRPRWRADLVLRRGSFPKFVKGRRSNLMMINVNFCTASYSQQLSASVVELCIVAMFQLWKVHKREKTSRYYELQFTVTGCPKHCHFQILVVWFHCMRSGLSGSKFLFYIYNFARPILFRVVIWILPQCVFSKRSMYT